LIDCNFIPKAYHDKRVVRRAVRRRSACAGIMFLMMIVWVGAHEHQVGVAEAMLADVTAQKQQLGLMVTERSHMEEEQARLRDQVELIEKLSNRAGLIVVLSDLSRCVPESVLITECSIKASVLDPYLAEVELPATAAKGRDARDVLAAPGVPVPGERLLVRGIALSSGAIIEFARNVDKSGLFANEYTETSDAVIWGDRRAEYSFEMTCDLLPHKKNPS